MILDTNIDVTRGFNGRIKQLTQMLYSRRVNKVINVIFISVRKHMNING